MRKLLFVLLLFILSIISLVLLFNTITNSSKQSNIQLIQELPSYPNAVQNLSQALRIPTTLDSNSTIHFTRFHQLLKQLYPAIFNNPNVEWQQFETFSLVAKWVGRTPELAPIVLVTEQYVEEPDLAHIPEWSYNPFMGKIDQKFIYGRGSQGGKAALLAMLEVLNDLVLQNKLPERTIYFAFPHNAEEGERSIVRALQEAKIHPEFILKTGGLISQNLLWKISQPTALIGIGRQSIAQVMLETQNLASEQLTATIEQLQTALPFVDVDQPSLKTFLSYISPEMPFGQRLIFSNQWLLSNPQQRQLQHNPLTQQLWGHNILTKTLSDSNNTRLVQLQFTAPKLIQPLESWIKNHLQHPQIRLLGTPQVIYKNNVLAPIDNHAYRLISNTCKEVFPHTISAPTLVTQQSANNWQDNINTDIYYFHPVIYDLAAWEKAQQKIDDKISIENYTQMLQFYYQLIINSI